MGVSTPQILSYKIYKPDYSNVAGAGAIIAGVGQTIGKLWEGKQQKDILEAQKEIAQQQATASLIANRRKNYLPIVIVGGVLLIGGIVVAATLLKK